jgi:hypothetical protein
MALKFLNDGFFDGKVGIGTDTPDATLEPVNISATSDGDGSASDTLSGQDSILLSTKTGTFEETSGAITWRNSTRRRAMITGVNEAADGDGDILGLAFYTQGTDGPGDFFESMRIAHSGNVGIGTSSPLDLLALHNNATGAVDAQMNFTTAATGQAAADGFRVGWNGTVAQMYLFENADMRIATNNVERMRITSAGGISFGSTGTAYGTSGQVLTSGGNASPTWTTLTTGTVTGSGTATQVAFWDGTSSLSGNNDLYWDSTNNHLGIGDNTPGSRLKVTSGTSETSIYTVDINHVKNNPDVATNAMRINMDLSGADNTTADRTNSGLLIDIDSSANGDASNEHRIRGINSDVKFTGFSDAVHGGYFLAESN